MLRDKLDAVRGTGAEILSAADSSCLMHMGGGLARQRAGVGAVHYAEILAGIAADDPRLEAGLHTLDGDDTGASWRWTDGSALLPASLWSESHGPVSLAVRLSGPALPRWVGPSERIETAALRLSA